MKTVFAYVLLFRHVKQIVIVVENEFLCSIKHVKPLLSGRGEEPNDFVISK